MGGGMQRILMGLMMMAASQVMATGVGPGGGVDTGFDLPARSLGAGDVWCLALGYGFQLFFNFAGYTHIVVGVARLFGIQLAENFNLPYLSRSPSEFWTRWHMSLSFWIRDYVFFPLATMRAEMWWRNACLVLAMFVFGVWHGGNAHYALYGIYHGLLLVAHRQWQRLGVAARVRLPQYVTTPLAWLGTFMAVTLGWILFRAQSLDQAAIMLQGALRPTSYGHHVLQKSFIGIILFAAVVYFLVVAISSALARQARKIARAEEEALSTPAPAHDRMLTLLARHRWVWVGPIALVFLLYAYLLIRPQGSLVGPMLYQIF
jgi:alginate O-acetyltransferase complex protein AlgI